MEIQFTSSKVFRNIITVFVFLITLGVSEVLVSLNQDLITALERVKLNNSASLLRNDLEKEINTTLQLSMGLIVNVAANPNISDQQYEKIASLLVKRAPKVINVGLAKDNIISHIYPYKGNEKALGLDYSKIKVQYTSVLKAMKAKNTVIAGPVNLVQGGVGIIGRIPIYTGENQEKYWGLASVVVSFDSLSTFIKSRANDLGVEIALRGRDGKGSEGSIFLGEIELFDPSKKIVQVPVTLPVGNWVLAVKQQSDISSSKTLWLYRLIGLLLSLIVTTLSFLLLKAHAKNLFLALHDPLTNLPNRRLFEIQLDSAISQAQRQKGMVSILYVDLDGFKIINDTHGHKSGDWVLRESARRMKSLLRKSDIVARIGGDEFVVILDNLQSDNTPAIVAVKIEQTLNKSITLENGTQVNVGASIGIATFPNHAETTELLIKHADEHMYSVKDKKTKQS